MSQLLRFNLIHIIILLFVTTSFVGCNKDMSISLDSSNEDIAVTLIDSFSINTSSYQLNYLPSASSGSVLIGKVNIPDLGSATSSAYLRLSLEGYTNDIPTDAVFDSVNVVLTPNTDKYYYGDTTQVQSISVHRVNETIITKNILTDIDSYKAPFYVTGQTIFADQKFNFDAIPLGTASFRPYVNSTDSVSVRLNDNFGLDIFDKIRANDYNVNNFEAFQNYLKGIVITPNTGNSAMIGFSDTVKVNINYSYIGSDGFKVQGKKVILGNSSLLQSNNIEYDRTSTPFAPLNNTNRELSSAATNNQLYVQSGTGLVTKINFPSLRVFLSDENISINKAELIIETESTTYGTFPTSSSLILMIANQNGLPTNYLPSPFSTTPQQAIYVAGNDVGENGRYIFNMIDYIKNINTNRYVNADLLISTASPSLFSTINTTKIATEGGKPKIKLNIVYTKFK